MQQSRQDSDCSKKGSQCPNFNYAQTLKNNDFKNNKQKETVFYKKEIIPCCSVAEIFKISGSTVQTASIIYKKHGSIRVHTKEKIRGWVCLGCFLKGCGCLSLGQQDNIMKK
jgi:hypothetical protein